jgi:hypothetical protein
MVMACVCNSVSYSSCQSFHHINYGPGNLSSEPTHRETAQCGSGFRVIRIENPKYHRFDMPYGTCRRAGAKLNQSKNPGNWGFTVCFRLGKAGKSNNF